MTADGQEFSVGDWQQEFTIQSICKPLAFLMALEQHGREETLRHVGIEPSGEAFNSIQLDALNRPFNPMVNAGAISVANLIKGSSPEDGVAHFVKRLSQAANRELRVDQAVCNSESETGHRNRAIAHLLLNFDMIDRAVDHTLH